MTEPVIFRVQDSPPKYLLTDGYPGCICGELYQALQQLQSQGVVSRLNHQPLPVKRIMTLVATEPGYLFCGASKNPQRITRFLYARIPLYEIRYVAAARADDAENPQSLQALTEQPGAIGALFGTTSSQFIIRHSRPPVNDSFSELETSLQLLGALLITS